MRRECAVVVDGQLGNNAPVCMTGSQNLRRDLCRVNFEVHNLKPFPHLAFPHFLTLQNTRKHPSFDGKLMASYLAHYFGLYAAFRITGEMTIFQQLAVK